MSTIQFNYAVIGVGVTGLAIKRIMLNKHASTKIVIFNKESPSNTSPGNNSNCGVFPSGDYYPKNSVKVKFFINSSKQLVVFAKNMNVQSAA